MSNNYEQMRIFFFLYNYIVYGVWFFNKNKKIIKILEKEGNLILAGLLNNLFFL